MTQLLSAPATGVLPIAEVLVVVWSAVDPHPSALLRSVAEANVGALPIGDEVRLRILGRIVDAGEITTSTQAVGAGSCPT